MAARYDIVVIGSGLGGLTAGALLSKAGCKTLLIERNHSIGGAATTYKVGDLVVEGSLHETSDPHHPLDPKNQILDRLGVLDNLTWVPTGPLYEARGGPLDAPFVLPESFGAVRAALLDRFPAVQAGTEAVLGDMERIAVGLGTLSRGREAFRKPRDGFAALAKLASLLRDWRQPLGAVFDRAFASNEAIKCALAANLAYYHDDPDTLWWALFAVAQGGYLLSGGRYIRGGSQRLSHALARVIQQSGGEILRGRAACQIRLDGTGRCRSLVHTARNGSDAVEVEASTIVSNAAPAVIATMLPDTARARFLNAYSGQRLSISLLSATFGLSVSPVELGFKSYSTVLFPSWMKKLSDYRRCAELLQGQPGKDMPVMTIVNYSAIDSGLGGPPYPLSMVCTDRLVNWIDLDKPGYDAKREQWRTAIVSAIDAEFPGFAARVVTSQLNTARSMADFLNAPGGAVYGFAPLPPAGPIWRGAGRSPETPIDGLILASSYAGSGGFTGAILAGRDAANLAMRNRTSRTS
jgi:phytoene dehydrogenase-like protein